jgi:hypothetical protein
MKAANNGKKMICDEKDSDNAQLAIVEEKRIVPTV